MITNQCRIQCDHCGKNMYSKNRSNAIRIARDMGWKIGELKQFCSESCAVEGDARGTQADPIASYTRSLNQ